MLNRRYPFLPDKVSVKQVEPFIIRSWQRSLELKLSQEKIENNDFLPTHLLRERLEANEELLRAIDSTMSDILCLLPSQDFLVLLSDPEGYILKSLGNPPFLTKAQQVFLSPGASWSERIKGTNAIGTALIESCPVEVLGWEHFVKENHFLSCWAAPIRNLKGELVGILDISGEATAIDHRNLKLAILAAKMVEQQLHCLELQRSIDFNKEVIKLAKIMLGSNFTNVFEDVKQVNQFTRSLGGKSTEITVQPQNLLVKNYSRTKVIPQLPKHKSNTHNQHAWIGSSDITKKVFQHAAKAAESSCPVLIMGESGTGKEVLARLIHENSSHCEEPFITLNCGSIPDSLIESELFGYAEGAFTGAKPGGNQGKFEAAKNGTILLDEIGETPANVQVALLRVLQEKEIVRIGESHPRKINARVITATNKSLDLLVEKRQFRLDLLYRLRVIVIQIPPLCYRPEDIYDLVPYFVDKACQSLGKSKMDVTEEVYNNFLLYKWPGNIRQLENCITSMVAMSDGTVLTYSDLPDELTCNYTAKESQKNSLLIKQTRQAILQALFQTKGKIAPAARLLGMGRATLYRKLKEYKIDF